MVGAACFRCGFVMDFQREKESMFHFFCHYEMSCQPQDIDLLQPSNPNIVVLLFHVSSVELDFP